MIRMAMIASGSGGNCTYIGTGDTHLIIDAGISMKRIREGLNELEVDLGDLDAIFVTHEHSDHIAGLPMIWKHHQIPIYSTAGTMKAVRSTGSSRGIADEAFHVIRAGDEVSIGDLTIRSFPISHDAADPVAYVASMGDRRVAVATDMGRFDAGVEKELTGLDALVIEANHDIRMLQAGPYPWPLKQRILSDYGHLSNDASGELLIRILNDHMKGILLGHLSAQNNLPELAYETVRVEIELSDAPYHGSDLPIEVAPRAGLSRIIEV